MLTMGSTINGKVVLGHIKTKLGETQKWCDFKVSASVPDSRSLSLTDSLSWLPTMMTVA